MHTCLASVVFFGLTKDDFIDHVQEIISVGEFYANSADG